MQRQLFHEMLDGVAAQEGGESPVDFDSIANSRPSGPKGRPRGL